MEISLPQTRIRPSAALYSLALGILALAGIGLVLAATRLGAGLTDDSYYYVSPARQALAGQGFNPSTMFSPMLPAVLLVLGWIGIEPLVAARFLYAALFGVNIVLVAAITRQVTGSGAAALLAAGWTLLSENLIDIHSWVMSEGLYFTFFLLALWSALRFSRGRRTGWLIAAGLCAGLACLSRYAGLAIVPAVALALLFNPGGRSSFLRRVGDAVVFCVLAALPVGLYFLRNLAVSGLATRYPGYVYVPFLHDNLVWYLYNTLSWFIPGRFLHGRELLAAGGVLAIAVFAAVWARLRGARPARQTVWGAGLLLLFVLMNSLMLYFARGFEALDVYNTRYLTPILIVLVALIASACWGLWRTGGRGMRVLLILAGIIFTAYYGYRAYDYIRQTARLGLGYANNGWHTSETVAYLRQSPQLGVVATGDTGLYFWTGRMPAAINAFGGVDGLHQHLCSSGDVLVIMDQMPAEVYGIDRGQAVQGLELLHRFNDSAMYGCKGTGS